MRRRILMLALVPLAACVDDPTAPQAVGPVQMTVVGATTPFVACATEFPVTVTVLNNRGKPYPNFLLNFNVLEGGGRVFGGAELTNSKGVAYDYWTIGNDSHQPNTLVVRAVDGSGARTTYDTLTVSTLNKIAYSMGDWPNRDIAVVNADGSGTPANLTNTPGVDDILPAFSPDGRKIAYVEGDGSYNYNIHVMNVDGSGKTQLTSDGRSTDPAWAPDNSTIFFTYQGGPDQVMYVTASNPTPQYLLYDGREPTVSPDFRWLAYTHAADTREIWVFNLVGSPAPHELTSHEPGETAYDNYPAWSPDGSRIAFIREEYPAGEGIRRIFVINADGSDEHAVTTGDYGEYYSIISFAWSPDGRKILYATAGPFATDHAAYVMNADGSAVTSLPTGDYPVAGSCIAR